MLGCLSFCIDVVQLHIRQMFRVVTYRELPSLPWFLEHKTDWIAPDSSARNTGVHDSKYIIVLIAGLSARRGRD